MQLENEFRDDISADQIEYLSEHFIISIISWLKVADYYTHIDKDEKVNYFSKLIFRNWVPYICTNKKEYWERLS